MDLIILMLEPKRTEANTTGPQNPSSALRKCYHGEF
jgi:hypothetical protein